MEKRILTIGCILAATGVILGAFGAHALGDQLTQAQQKTYQTGVEYHFIHSLALCILALSTNYISKKQLKTIALLFCIGILFFPDRFIFLPAKTFLGLNPGNG